MTADQKDMMLGNLPISISKIQDKIQQDLSNPQQSSQKPPDANQFLDVSTSETGNSVDAALATPDKKPDNKMMYWGIGAGALVLVIGAIFFFRSSNE